MNVTGRTGIRMMATAMLICIASCGPGTDEADIHVSTSIPDGDTAPAVVGDTVVRIERDMIVQPGTTVIQQQTDTVVQPGVTIVQQKTDTVVQTVPGGRTTSPVSGEEQRRIDSWLAAHADSLNQFGDPKETAYAGGTPLFDEASGRTISKYDYIVSRHPDRPWMTNPGTNAPVQAQPRRNR